MNVSYIVGLALVFTANLFDRIESFSAEGLHRLVPASVRQSADFYENGTYAAPATDETQRYSCPTD